MKILKNKTYKNLISDYSFFKKNFFDLQKKCEKQTDKIVLLEKQLEKAASEGYKSIGGYVIKIFQLHEGKSLPVGAKDIVLVEKYLSNEGWVFFYQASIWESEKNEYGE